MAALLTIERLRELIDYDPATGLFICKIARINRRIGDVEHGTCGRGYIAFCLDGKQYYAHRLAWFYVHGVWPRAEIDHVNRDITDNRMSNLREATRAQNAKNVPGQTLKGIMPNHERWQAQIRVDGKRIYLGTFDTRELAHAAYCEASRRMHGEFGRY